MKLKTTQSNEVIENQMSSITKLELQKNFVRKREYQRGEEAF